MAKAEKQYERALSRHDRILHRVGAQIKTPIAAIRLALQNEDTPLSRRLTGEVGRVEQYVQMALTYLRLGSDSSDYVIRSCALDVSSVPRYGALRASLSSAKSS